ncbi:oligosaccharide flippase family protein [Candidatus Beckwithbacteria bacterium]|nr:oligosaccharide flippase family protein [Candidatus Beckwithbacteria bacterium]
MSKSLAHKATKSVLTLTSRTFILNIINFIGAFALTIFLSPADFGVFILTSTVIDILVYFSDIGLAGALIQKKEDLQDNEIHTTFTIQMGLVSLGILIASFFANNFKTFYNLDQLGIYLYFALLLSFFLSSLKTIPSVISERNLKFENIVIPQIIETVSFNAIVVFMAFKGFGIKSYIVAVLVRALTGTISIYLLVRWKPKLGFDFKAIKKLLSFGIPYQLNSLIAVFKDRVSILILGKILGLEAIGILGWAEKWANLPLRYFMDSTIKVAFPLFSRVQENLDQAKASLEKALYFISFLILPSLAGAYLVMPLIIEIIPKYYKWQPGLNTFNLFLISAAIASISTFLTNFLTAMGKVKQNLYLMIMWTSLTLILYPFFAFKFNFQGVAMASIIISLTSLIPYLLVRKIIKFNLLKQIYPAFFASILMIIIVKLLDQFLFAGIYKLISATILGAMIYLIIIFLLDKKNLLNQVKTFLNYARK